MSAPLILTLVAVRRIVQQAMTRRVKTAVRQALLPQKKMIVNGVVIKVIRLPSTNTAPNVSRALLSLIKKVREEKKETVHKEIGEVMAQKGHKERGEVIVKKGHKERREMIVLKDHIERKEVIDYKDREEVIAQSSHTERERMILHEERTEKIVLKLEKEIMVLKKRQGALKIPTELTLSREQRVVALRDTVVVRGTCLTEERSNQYM